MKTPSAGPASWAPRWRRTVRWKWRAGRAAPRIAGRLLRRVADFALYEGATTIDRKLADKALLRLDVDARGLDMLDRRYLKTRRVLQWRPGRYRDHRGGAQRAARRDRGDRRAHLLQQVSSSAPRAAACSPASPSSTWAWPCRRASWASRPACSKSPRTIADGRASPGPPP